MDSSIGDLVTHWLTHWVSEWATFDFGTYDKTCDLWDFLTILFGLICESVYNFLNKLQFLTISHLWTIFNLCLAVLAILTIFDNFHNDNDNDNSRDLWPWNIDYNSDNWEPECMIIFMTWQLRVTLDSIRNNCDVFYPSWILMELIPTSWILHIRWNYMSSLKQNIALYLNTTRYK